MDASDGLQSSPRLLRLDPGAMPEDACSPSLDDDEPSVPVEAVHLEVSEPGAARAPSEASRNGRGAQEPPLGAAKQECGAAADQPSREAAERRRKMTLILDRRTGDHVPLTAGPRKIGAANPGLGIYLVTLRMYCAFALANVAIFMYPLVLNASTSNWELGWELLVSPPGTNGSTFECTFDSGSAQAAAIGTIPRTTPSSFCLDSPYTSAFVCPSRCVFNRTEALSRVLPDGTACADMADEVAALADVELGGLGMQWDDREACALHPPCALLTPGGARPAAAGCTCCEPLELREEDLATYPAGALAAMLISQAAFIAWMLLLWKKQITCAEAINKDVVTLPDYTVWVKASARTLFFYSFFFGPTSTLAPRPGVCDSRAVAGQGLPRDCTDNRRVAEFFRHYGEVVSSSTIIPVGEVLCRSRAIKEMQITLEELRAKAALEEAGGCGCRLLGSWLYWRLLSGLRGPAKAAECLEARIALEKERRLAAETAVVKELRNDVGEALVTMNYEVHKKNAIIDNQGGSSQVCLKWVRRSRGVYSSTRMDGHVIKVKRAPEPSDYIWENTSHRDRTARQVLGSAIFVAAVAAASVVQYFMQSLAEEEREKRISSFLDKEFHGQEGQGNLISFVGDKLNENYISILNGLVVVLLNLIVAEVQSWTSNNVEKWSTSSAREASNVVRVSLFYLLNSFAIPIISAYANFQGDGGQVLWYISGGVIESLFWIQVFNAVLGDITALLGIFRLLNTHVFSHYALTQDQLDRLLQLPAESVSLRYASAVKTLALAMLTAPVLPISAALSLVGLIISYWTDKVLFLRLSSKPPKMSYKFTKAINRVLVVLPALQLVLMRFLYFEGQPHMDTIFIVGMVFWVIFGFGFEAIRRALGIKRVRTREDDGTRGRPYQDTLGKLLLDDRAARTASDAGQQQFIPQIPIYRPPIPQGVCTTEFWSMIEQHFANESEGPLPAIPTLLDHQLPSTGGDNTLPPLATEAVAAELVELEAYPSTPISRSTQRL